MKSRRHDFNFEENLKLSDCDPVVGRSLQNLQPQAVSKARVKAQYGFPQICLIDLESYQILRWIFFLKLVGCGRELSFVDIALCGVKVL